MTYRFPIHVGDRVAIAPHHDLWMAGCRFGTVTGGETDHVGGEFYFLALDTGANVMLHKDDLLGAVGEHKAPEGATGSTEEPPYLTPAQMDSIRASLRSIETTLAELFEASDRYFGAKAAEMQSATGSTERWMFPAYRESATPSTDDYDHCAHEDCGYGECSWLQAGPVEGMCQTHGNGEGRCQRDWCPVDGVECAEGGHRNDDNPGRPICATCDDDPNVSALYPEADGATPSTEGPGFTFTGGMSMRMVPRENPLTEVDKPGPINWAGFSCPEFDEDGSCIHSDHMAQAEAAAASDAEYTEPDEHGRYCAEYDDTGSCDHTSGSL